MPYTVADWFVDKEIFVPVSELTLVSGTEYNLDMRDFLNETRRMEWSFTEGLGRPQIVDWTKEKTLAGATYAPFAEIINGYSVRIEPVATRVNLLGANTNFTDVLVANGVTVVPSNSAGLQLVNSGQAALTPQDIAAVAAAVWDHLISGWKARTWLHLIFSAVLAKVTGATTYGTPGKLTFQNKDGNQDIYEVDNDGVGNRTSGNLLNDPET